MATRTKDIAQQAGADAGRAFAQGFAQQLPRSQRGRRGIRTLQRHLAQATARR